jgi:serpin B
MDTALAHLVEANTRFSFKLFAELAQRDFGRNMFVSPLSIGMALAMLYNGASGETRQAIATVLALHNLDLTDVNNAYALLLGQYDRPDQPAAQEASRDDRPRPPWPAVRFMLAIANSLWARRDITFVPDFVRRSQDFYRAEIVPIDFHDPGAPALINAWVHRHTNGKISHIVDSVSPLAALIVINTIYFKAYWRHQFRKASTKPTPFTYLYGTRKQCPLMYQTNHFAYYRSPNFEAISLPYLQRHRDDVSMYVFLPRRDLRDFQARLTAENWETWLSRFKPAYGQIGLPRFDFSYETLLRDTLTRLGMGVAFDRQHADLSAVSETAWLDQIQHKALVRVDEEGTEAAAVTAGVVVAGRIRPPRVVLTEDTTGIFCTRIHKLFTVWNSSL